MKWEPVHVRKIAGRIEARTSGGFVAFVAQNSDSLASMARTHGEVSPRAMEGAIERVARVIQLSNGSPKEAEAEALLGLVLFVTLVEEDRIHGRKGKESKTLIREMANRVIAHFHSSHRMALEMARNCEAQISALSRQWGLEGKLAPVPA